MGIKNDINEILKIYDKKKTEQFVEFIVDSIASQFEAKEIRYERVDYNKIYVFDDILEFNGSSLVEVHLYKYTSGLRKYIKTRSENTSLIRKSARVNRLVKNYIYLSTFSLEDLTQLYVERASVINRSENDFKTHFYSIYEFENELFHNDNQAFRCSEVINDSTTYLRFPERKSYSISRIVRDTSLSTALKIQHSNICQICGLQLKIGNNKFYSEAHHLKPLGSFHKGPDTSSNMIVLCPNHHVQCDRGAIKIDRNEIESGGGHIISDEYINYHNDFIFHEGV